VAGGVVLKFKKNLRLETSEFFTVNINFQQIKKFDNKLIH